MKVDKIKLYNYIKANSENIKDMSTDEIIKLIMGIYHLEYSNNYSFNINLALSGSSLILALLATGPLLIAGSLTTCLASCIGCLKNNKQEKRLLSLKVVLVEEVMNRYPNFLEAYLDIKDIIQNIEKEEILELFEKANSYNE